MLSSLACLGGPFDRLQGSFVVFCSVVASREHSDDGEEVVREFVLGGRTLFILHDDLSSVTCEYPLQELESEATESVAVGHE